MRRCAARREDLIVHARGRQRCSTGACCRMPPGAPAAHPRRGARTFIGISATNLGAAMASARAARPRRAGADGTKCCAEEQEGLLSRGADADGKQQPPAAAAIALSSAPRRVGVQLARARAWGCRVQRLKRALRHHQSAPPCCRRGRLTASPRCCVGALCEALAAVQAPHLPRAAVGAPPWSPACRSRAAMRRRSRTHSPRCARSSLAPSSRRTPSRARACPHLRCVALAVAADPARHARPRRARGT